MVAPITLTWRQGVRKIERRNVAFRGITSLVGIAAVVFLLLALLECFTVIPAGYVGVVDFFGTVSEKTQEHKENMQALSREGLTIGLEISALYRLNPDSAARVYQTILGGDRTEAAISCSGGKGWRRRRNWRTHPTRR